jgi:D-cysteine desulfhydrase family pyridoxal phosphate-dependent enzyme
MEPNISAALDALPRYRLARLPTPLHELPRLREELGGAGRCPRILIKRDDLTDLALGGNKARKLEFLVGDARRAGATALVTTGAVQSNHARMTVAAARLAGMRASLVLTADCADPETQGNLLLDKLMGADVHFVNGSDPVSGASPDAAEAALIEQVMHDLRRAGERPYLVVLGGSCRVGTLGYVQFTRELVGQLKAMNRSPGFLYYASGSRGTQAGLELGARIFGAPYRCVGIAVSGGEPEKRLKAARIANEAAESLGSSVRLDADDLVTDQDYYGTAYGVPTPEGIEAIRLLASTEAIFLDPVYTSKGMAGLIAHIRSGRIDPAQTIIFLHTGGLPALFAKADQVESLMGAAS